MKKIGIISLSLFIIGSIDSIRNMPVAALFGDKLILFFVLGLFFFLLPVGIISSFLSVNSDKNNKSHGIYGWVEVGVGSKTAFFAIWLQWINTVVWYPTILAFISATAAYIISPNLANNRIYLSLVMLVLFWGLTVLNLRGIKLSSVFVSWCTTFGVIIPVVLIVILGAVWIFKGFDVQVSVWQPDIYKHFYEKSSWVSVTAIVTSFLGLELAAVHAKNFKQKSRTFTVAMFLSVFVIFFTMVFGSLAVAIVLPKNSISLTNGIMQVFSRFFNVFHVGFLIPLFAIVLVVGSIGGVVNWLISPVAGLAQAAKKGFLPRFFKVENKFGIAKNILFFQAIVVSFMCLLFSFLDSINGLYWFLTDLSTELYIVMYILMFVASFGVLFKKAMFSVRKKLFLSCINVFGLIGCLVAFFIGFHAPDTIFANKNFWYAVVFAIGIFVLLSPSLIFYFLFFKNKSVH